MSDLDLVAILAPEKPILEMVLRGTLTYLALFLLLRFTLKRESSTVGVTNLLLLVLIADAAQNAMADDYSSVADGIVLVATILFWSYALDWLGYRVPRLRRFVHPDALPLVLNGQLQVRNMRRELITEEELWTQLRLQGIEDLSEVRAVYLEGNGEVSVLRADGSSEGSRGTKRQAGAAR